MFDPFVGLSYVDNGRSLEGVDCWGLVWLASAAAGHELPSYHDRYVLGADREELAALIAGELPAWDEIAAGHERSMDCVLMREGHLARHIGIVTRPGFVLHIERGRSSVIETYRSGLLRHRVIGFYRYSGIQ